MSRTLRSIVAVLLLVAAFGYRYLRDHASPAAPKHRNAVAASPAPVRKYGRIAFVPCTLSSQSAMASVEAECGSLSVAENPALPQGRHIALHIAWVPANDTGTSEPDPVFMLAGGPGQAATDSYPQVAPAFVDVLKKRGVILVDQRGTGQSNPLACPDDKDKDDAGDTATAPPTGVDAARAMAQRCRDALSPRADLRFYTTTDAIRDLEAVRQAIGAATINLVGISYGTRVAQQYAMRYPHSTRTLVLDSVAPNTLIVGNEFAHNLEQALDLQFGECGKVPACARALGNPRSRLDALMTTLRTSPPLVR